jgi:putative nucleotidyltransferase with HDIG domain
MRRAPVTVDRVNGWLSEVREHVRNLHLESTRALVAAVEARDPYTRAHSTTVARYAVCLGRRLGLPPAQLAVIRLAGLLHDVGKIGVPDAILTKPGPLTPQEFEIVKCHPQTAVDILSPVSVMTEERRIILHHHERFDGTGYPDGLCGEHIPVGARILAVADALDTMLSPRTYKQPYDVARVREELIRGAGRQFDPCVVDAALDWLNEEAPNCTAAASAAAP